MLRRRILESMATALVPSLAFGQGRTVLDMAGDSVELPRPVRRVATLGPVPVINSLVFAVGEGRRIVNGLPVFAQKPRWAYQAVVAPQITGLPSLQNPDRTPNFEALLRAKPDVVFTMDRSFTQAVRRIGLPAVHLAWRQPGDVKKAVALVGDILERPAAAARYAQRFDELLAQVEAGLQREPFQRPRVLYFSPATLTTPHLVVEWWIRAAGGESVSDDGREVEARTFSLEQLLAWDPEILIAPSPEEAQAVRRDPRFARLAAVRNQRVLAAPCGVHPWGHRTAEQPLTVVWAARKFHPRLFASLDDAEQTRNFYRDLFGVHLQPAQVREILAGGPRNP